MSTALIEKNSYNFSACLLPGARSIKAYAEKLIVEIKPEQFASFPLKGDVSIQTNHPAFVFGHLSLYPSRVFKLLGRDALSAEIKPSDKYTELFNMNAKCLDDKDLKIYPGMHEIVEYYFKGSNLVLNHLSEIGDDAFIKANPEERTKERFPVVSSFIAYLVLAHQNQHLGQISAWRRFVGLGASSDTHFQPRMTGS